LFGEVDAVREGDEVRRTQRIASINVGEGMLGRVIDPLGVPIDGRGRRSLSAIDRGLLAGGAKGWALCGSARIETDGLLLTITPVAGPRTPPKETT
ncbi:MAG: hypothetical protein KUG77_24565, partial [Nannocystaceae bacterium]|nr:hypothetical protein [Nannocystaceae bacterium]